MLGQIIGVVVVGAVVGALARLLLKGKSTRLNSSHP